MRGDHHDLGSRLGTFDHGHLDGGVGLAASEALQSIVLRTPGSARGQAKHAALQISFCFALARRAWCREDL